MCGISGVLAPGERTCEELEALAGRMADTMRHRGPDDSGVWSDPVTGVAFGHRRLAVVDTSREGHQPMISADGRMVITFNGELYNHASLRRRLEGLGSTFRSRCDTEVVVEALATWGIPHSLQSFNGMFALAIWDRHERTLTLTRDRFGEKPLYYGWAGGTFAFASELKAFRPLPGRPTEIDDTGLALFLRHGHVPAPACIYRDVRKLPPASLVELRAPVTPGMEPTAVSYSRLDQPAETFEGSFDDACQAVERSLADSMGLRLEADVPVGAFLSSGVDSSLLAALGQQLSGGRLRTFTIGFEDPRFDESAGARDVASRLETHHTEHRVSEADVLALVPSVPFVYDEPFADSSQLPTMILSQLTRRDVTVAISGDGGDELFAGYARHNLFDPLWRVSQRVPRLLRAPTSMLLSGRAGQLVASSLARGRGVLPRALRVDRPDDKLAAVEALLPASGRREAYERVTAYWWDPDPLLVRPPPGPFPGSGQWSGDGLQSLLDFDVSGYLPNDLLVKVDRASMASSLEVRLPFLDPHTVELARSLPSGFKIVDGQGKAVLRAIRDRLIPGLPERPKTGFGVPLGAWLRGPLRGWAEDLLSRGRIESSGFLRPDPIIQSWRDHLAGRRDNRHRLWAILCFQAWLEDDRGKPSCP